MAFQRKKTTPGSMVKIILADGSLSELPYEVLNKTTDSKGRVELKCNNGSNIKVHYERIVITESESDKQTERFGENSKDDSINHIERKKEMSTEVAEQTVASTTMETSVVKKEKPQKVARPPKKTKEEIMASIPLFNIDSLKNQPINIYVGEDKPWGNHTIRTIVLFTREGNRQQIVNLYNGRLSLSNPTATINVEQLVNGTSIPGVKQLWKTNDKFSEEKLTKSGYKKVQ